ncbi:hypothetical protein QJS10_CPA02g00038 [Acorus calamus]|uniref:SCP domain-containing protein n=1 Tax=Acorus calamus TaxID=4465 RepID=A0AAV9FCS1_ACOCL|nr:hypothetical protein QJS10_CPA02g00038 [Acorus calamus]
MQDETRARLRNSKVNMRVSTVACAYIFMTLGTLMVVRTTQAQNSPQDFLDAHNAARAHVGVGPMSWDDTVAAYARDYAHKRAADCTLEHSDPGGLYGENIFEGSGSDWTASDAVNLWVEEVKDYDYNSNTCAAGQVCGHYTQVVWARSVKLGCARVTCTGGGVFITCNYSPPGNIVGERPY